MGNPKHGAISYLAQDHTIGKWWGWDWELWPQVGVGLELGVLATKPHAAEQMPGRDRQSGVLLSTL